MSTFKLALLILGLALSFNEGSPCSNSDSSSDSSDSSSDSSDSSSDSSDSSSDSSDSSSDSSGSDDSGSGPILMMRRDTNSSGCTITSQPVTYLNVGWEAYKQSFNGSSCYFWLGLEEIHQLTTSGNYNLEVSVLNGFLVTGTATYSNFRVGDEASNYTMTTSGFSTDGAVVGDRFFLTDSDRTFNGTNFCVDGRCESNADCGRWAMGGWWYTDVCLSNPHNQWGIEWTQGNGDTTTMKEMNMTLIPA